MTANRIMDWVHRWWLVGVIIMAAIFYVIMKLLPSSKDKAGAVEAVKAQVNALVTQKTKEHEDLKAEMDVRQAELIRIKAISNEKERLQKLADFANRRKT